MITPHSLLPSPLSPSLPPIPLPLSPSSLPPLLSLTLLPQAHDSSVRSMQWSHNSLWMATTDDRGVVKYWQSNMNNVHTFQAHNEPIRGCRWDPRNAAPGMLSSSVHVCVCHLRDKYTLLHEVRSESTCNMSCVIRVCVNVCGWYNLKVHYPFVAVVIVQDSLPKKGVGLVHQDPGTRREVSSPVGKSTERATDVGRITGMYQLSLRCNTFVMIRHHAGSV